MLALFGGAYYSYSFLAFPVQFLGETVAANRLAALGITILLGLALYLALTRTRAGTAIRAVAVDPFAAQLVAINVPQASALDLCAGRRAGGRGRRAGQHVPHLQRVIRRGLHHEGVDRRGDGRRRQHAGLPGRGPGAWPQRGAGCLLCRSRPDAGRQLRAVPRRAAGEAGRPVRQGDSDDRANRRPRRPRAGSACAAGLRAASRQRLLSRARHQPPAVHRAGDGLGHVLRAHALRLAGDDRLLRRRRLYRGRARRDIALAAGAADRSGARRHRGGRLSGSRRCA